MSEALWVWARRAQTQRAEASRRSQRWPEATWVWARRAQTQGPRHLASRPSWVRPQRAQTQRAEASELIGFGSVGPNPNREPNPNSLSALANVDFPLGAFPRNVPCGDYP